MPTAPFGDDLWLTPGIRSFFKRLREIIRRMLAKISGSFDRKCLVA
jgi:hypothetical protein